MQHCGNESGGNDGGMSSIVRTVETDHPLLIGDEETVRTICVVDGDAARFRANVGKQGIHLVTYHITATVLTEVCVGLVRGIAMHHTGCCRGGKRGNRCHGSEQGAAEGKIQVKFHGSDESGKETGCRKSLCNSPSIVKNSRKAS